jgi:anthranilate synthase/aminodeoxychorismate synthase-like glutamine amidotransferase
LALIFIDNYDSFSATILSYLKKISLEKIVVFQNDNIEFDSILENDKIIISPGPNIPKASGQLMKFIETFKYKNAMLGICLGHQAIAESFGAELINFKTPCHGKQVLISVVQEDLIFKNSNSTFYAGLYHSWYVSENNFPEQLIITSKSNENIIMSFKHQTLPIFGVQFHPESYMTEFGLDLLKNFISIK